MYGQVQPAKTDDCWHCSIKHCTRDLSILQAIVLLRILCRIHVCAEPVHTESEPPRPPGAARQCAMLHGTVRYHSVQALYAAVITDAHECMLHAGPFYGPNKMEMGRVFLAHVMSPRCHATTTTLKVVAIFAPSLV